MSATPAMRARGQSAADGVKRIEGHSVLGIFTGLFVDSGPRFGYSGVLARCCAWGLCVCRGPQSAGLCRWGDLLTRTQLVEALEGSAGTGHRLLDARVSRKSRRARAFSRASPRNPHPNRFVWKWVEFRPVRFWRGSKGFALLFLVREVS
jgi:hypothetical protein